MKNKLFSTKQITKISILAVISAILLIINFPVFIFPSFYKIDFADVPRLLCGFAIGPLAGIFCTIVSMILNVIFEGGSETAFVGEIASLLISISFVLPASIIYKNNHTKKGAIISLLISTIIASIVSVFVNYYILFPMYETFMNIPMDAIIDMASSVIPQVNSKMTLVLLCTFPFNLLKTLLNSLIIVTIYKRISPLLKENRA